MIPEKYSHIDFKPPSGVKREAEYGLKLRREHGRGGTAVGIARARDLSNGEQLSPSTVRRMKAFFDRHQSDEKAEGFTRGDKGYPSNGLIANKLWGGSSGYSWAKKVVEQMEAAEERSLRPFGSTQGIKPKVTVVHGPPAAGKTSYVMENKGDNDVIFDFDKVMSALSGKPPHQKNDSLISYCTDVRDLIIGRALRGSEKVDRTWIVTTKVSDEMRGKLSDVPVEYVHINTPKEECLKRIDEDPERAQCAEELRQVVEEYFQTPESRSISVPSNVERRFLGNFNSADTQDPDLLKIEKRADPSTGKTQTYIVGYAARFQTDSLLMGDFVERIDPGAFDIVTNRKDEEGKPVETRCLFNHDPNHLLGRFPTTMKMYVDAKGLRYETLLPESRSDIAESVARGDLKGSSFSFVISDDGGEKWTYENGRSIRIVKKIKALLDCGPVTYPAYNDATVAVAKRSYQQFSGAKAAVVETRNATKAKATKVSAETREFLEKRGFCATGAGGGIDNSCGATSGSDSAPKNTAGMKKGIDWDKAKEDYDNSPSSTAGSAATGAFAGAALGLLAGLPGALAGAVVGGVAGAAAHYFSGSDESGPLKVPSSGGSKDEQKLAGMMKASKSAKKAGITDEKFNAVVREAGEGSEFMETPGFKGFFVRNGNDNYTVTSDKLVKEASGTTIHYLAGDTLVDDAGKITVPKASKSGIAKAEKMATAAGASAVTTSTNYSDTASQKLLSSLGFVRSTPIAGRKAPSGVVNYVKPLSAKKSSRGFCPTGKGNGIDNSCGGNKDGGGSDKYTPKDDDGDVFSKHGNGPIVPKADLGKHGGGPIVPAADLGKAKGDDKYIEWDKSKDYKSAKKTAAAQDFIDKAREEQMSKGGKDDGMADEGGGVQTWSKGDHYPWTPKQVGTDEGYIQGIHPDGSKTEKYPFKGGNTTDAYKQMSDEVKRRKGKRSYDAGKVARETIEFLKSRRSA